MTTFNEDSRVKIPALLHLSRLGYDYLSLKQVRRDEHSNIFPELLQAALLRINPDLHRQDLSSLLDEIRLDLQNEDLGKTFHKRLTARSGVRLIDFDNLDNNSWHAVTELPFENGEDNFRPDITLLVNGLPLAIIEVKKRMNPGGVLEERRRMDRRHANRKFRHFFNLIQLQVFSNNMEYDEAAIDPVQGAFYAASTYDESHFNYFREERAAELLPRQARWTRLSRTSSSPTPTWSASRARRSSSATRPPTRRPTACSPRCSVVSGSPSSCSTPSPGWTRKQASRST